MPGLVDTHQTDAPERAGVYLLTHPRSASNLFQTMMEKQPGYQTSGYKLFDAGFQPLTSLDAGPFSARPKEEREAMYNAFREGYKGLVEELADAKSKGLQVFVKEHAILLRGADKITTSAWPEDSISDPLVLEDPSTPHTNPSTLPDRLLLSLQPIFQIRHPMLMFPSMVRAQRDSFKPDMRPRDKMGKVMLTLRHSRDLYDWYREHAATGMRPRVIDADDVMNDPEAVRQLCVETGLDPNAVQYEWEEKVVEDPFKKRFLSTISGSRGIVKGLSTKGLDLETETEKWRGEFGEEDARDLAEMVKDALPDYKYMLAQRTRGGGGEL